jgi:type VI secretion system protein ImpJ
MRQLQPVLWTKGAFLQAQHLQNQDLYLESQLQFCLDSLFAYPNGFKTLTVDTARLATGYFSVSAASGIFPDGLLFDIPGSDHEPEARVIDRFPEGQNRLIVSLGIPQYRPGVRNVSFGPREKAASRYVADCLDLRDETSGLDEKPIQIARRNITYLLPHDDTTGYATLPVARILKKGDKLEVDRTFIPPLLQISASPSLLSMLRDITGLLTARCTELSQSRKSKYSGVADFTISDTASFWLLYTVNAHYPIFRYLLNSPLAHPNELFAQMLVLAGALTAFTLRMQPAELPDYNHDDLETCFSELYIRLRELLDTAIPKYFVSLPLRPTEQHYVYAASIPEDRFLTDTRVYLAVSAEMKPEQLIQMAPSITKIASSAQIQEIINSAVSGVRIARPPQLPNAIPVRQGFQYFLLETAGPYWQGIVRSRSLAVYVPSAVAKPTMELVILLKTEV